jgi:polysaccharide pyruvyl transferase WcaK-like protein
VLPIQYEPKTREVFEHLGQGAHVLDINHMEDEDTITRALDPFLGWLESHRADFFSRVNEVRAAATASIDAFDHALFAQSGTAAKRSDA